MTTPTISIVTATRNRRHLLAETLASVRDQTLAEWEHIVVDDHSNDGTAEYLESLPDPRVRGVILQQHGERSAARNLGLSQARAPYVMFLDDDDCLRPDALRLLSGELDRNSALVAAVGTLRFREPSLDSILHFQTDKPLTLGVWRELLFTWSSASGQNLYRSHAVRVVGGYDPRYVPSEDRAMWLRVARLGPVRILPDVVLDYRIHDGQSKPANREQIRAKLFSDFIDGLPEPDAAQARDLRESLALLEKNTIGSWFQCVVNAPYVLKSPLLRRPLWWRLRSLLLRWGHA